MAPTPLGQLGETLWRNKPPVGFPSPSWVLLQDLVDADLEGFVVEALADVILVNPELGRRHRLPLRDPGQIKPELSVVAALMVELSVMLHWNRKQPISHLLCSPSPRLQTRSRVATTDKGRNI